MGTFLAKIVYIVGAYQISKNLIVPVVEGAIDGVQQGIKEQRAKRKARKMESQEKEPDAYATNKYWKLKKKEK